MWFRIQSEGFITTAQTGGDIPPNWGHQSSCCCVLSSVQIAPFFFFFFFLFCFFFFLFNLFTFPSPPFSPLLPLAPYHWDLLSLAVGCAPPRLHFKWRRCAGAAPRYRQAGRKRERERGRREQEPSCTVDASSRHRIPTSGAAFFPMSTSVSLTGLIWALIS